MAENTIQYDWIVKIKGGIDHLFAGDPNVFVAGDLFWYPVEGHPEIVVAPDVLVAFGRPRGHRLSYMQWVEGGIPPQVVVEVLSPGNRFGEMQRKFQFYERHGVEEYYIYDPGPGRLELTGYLRKGDHLIEIPEMNGHVSPRLTVRFEMDEQGMRIIRPDGRPFVTFEESAEEADQNRHRAEKERLRAEQQTQRAEQQTERAEQQTQRADQALARVEELTWRLRALGQDPDESTAP